MATVTSGDYVLPPGTDAMGLAAAAEEDAHALLHAFREAAADAEPSFAAFAAAWRSLQFSAIHRAALTPHDRNQVLALCADAALHMLSPALPLMSRTCGAYMLYALATTSLLGMTPMFPVYEKHWDNFAACYRQFEADGPFDALQALQSVLAKKVLVFCGGLAGEPVVPSHFQASRLWSRQENELYEPAGPLTRVDCTQLAVASQDYQQAKAALKASELGRTHPGFAQHLTAFKQSFCNQRDLRLYKTMRNLGQVAAVPRSRNQRLVKPSGRYSKVHEGITRAAGEIALALPPPRAFLEADAAVQSAGLVDTAALIQRSSGASGGKRGRRQKSAVDADEVDVSAAASAASTAPASPTVRGRGRPRGRPRGSRAPASSRGTGSTGDVISRTESPAPSEASVQSLTSKTRRRRMYGVNGHLIPYVASMLATQEEEQSAAAAAAAEAVERAQEEALLDKAADEAMAAVQQAAAAQTATVEEREEEEVEEAEGEDDEDDEVEYDLAAGVEIYDPDEDENAASAAAAASPEPPAKKKTRGRKPLPVIWQTCPMCPKKFRFPSHLKAHLARHQAKKKK